MLLKWIACQPAAGREKPYDATQRVWNRGDGAAVSLMSGYMEGRLPRKEPACFYAVTAVRRSTSACTSRQR